MDEETLEQIARRIYDSLAKSGINLGPWAYDIILSELMGETEDEEDGDMFEEDWTEDVTDEDFSRISASNVWI